MAKMINRRTSIKALFLVVLFIVTSVSIYKWLRMSAKPKLYLLGSKKDLIAEIAEMIIPKTEIPGAKDANVEDFIIGMVKFCSDVKTQNNFLRGLDKLEDQSIESYGNHFLKCSTEEKMQILGRLEKSSTYGIGIFDKINHRLFGKPFIIQIKELTVEGYCTSKIGATRGLVYDYIPGNYISCMPMIDDQIAWATK